MRLGPFQGLRIDSILGGCLGKRNQLNPRAKRGRSCTLRLVGEERETAMTRTVQTKQEVVKALFAQGARIRALGVERLGLFGSYVRGEQGPGSDVDVLVEFKPGQKTFDNFMALSFLLEELLQQAVELVTPEALSPHIGPHILKEVEYVAFSV
jgi:predicted nucleotidyltransferase